MQVNNIESIYIVVTGLSLISTILFVTASNILYSCFLLIFIFFLGLCTFFIFNAPFLGLLVLMVYIGAIATLFLFIILMIDFYTQVVQVFDSEKLLCVITLGIGLVLICNNPIIMQRAAETGADSLWMSISEYWYANSILQTEPKCMAQIHPPLVGYTRDRARLRIDDDLLNSFALFKHLLAEATRVNYIGAQDGWTAMAIDIQLIGKVLYTHFTVIFLLCGLILLVAIIGILVAAEFSFRRAPGDQNGFERKQDTTEQIYKLYTYYDKERIQMGASNIATSDKTNT